MAFQKVSQYAILLALIFNNGIFASQESSFSQHYEPIFKSVINQSESLDVIVESGLQDLANGLIKNADVQAIADALRPLRQELFTLKNIEPMGLDEADLTRAVNQIIHITGYVRQLVDSEFKYTKTYEPVVVNRGQQTAVRDLEELNNELLENLQTINTTNAKLESMGLTWYNKAYRAVDSTVIKPMQRWHVPKIAFYGGLTGLAAVVLWYHSQSENPLLRKIFGYPPKLIGGTLDENWHSGKSLLEHVENTSFKGPLKDIANNVMTRPLKWPGQLEYFYHKYVSGYMPALSIMAPIAFAQYKDAFGAIKKKCSIQLNRAVGFLKGGEHKFNSQSFSRWNSTKTFDDYIGYEHAKEIGRKIINYIINPKPLARKKILPERGILLIGEPGTGKTEWAKALCGETQRTLKALGRSEVSFFEIPTSLITKPVEAGGIGGIANLIQFARNMAPCVLFIDEFDLLHAQRVGDTTLLSELLTSMNGFTDDDPEKQVIIIGATNKPENIDTALRRAGRFGTTIHFDLPTFENRSKYLINRLHTLCDLEQFDIPKLACETEGCTYELLNDIIKEAFTKAKDSNTVLSQELIEKSAEEKLYGILPKLDKEISRKELSIIASHQAGTALAYCAFDETNIVSKVTINPYNVKLREEHIWNQYYPEAKKQQPIQHGKVFTFVIGDTLRLTTDEDKIVQCKVLLAGPIAQETLLGVSSNNYAADNNRIALEIITSLAFEGIKPEQLPKEVREQKSKIAYELWNKCKAEVQHYFNENKVLLAALTNKLLKEKTVSLNDINQLQFHIKLQAMKPEEQRALLKENGFPQDIIDQFIAMRENEKANEAEIPLAA